jgi:flagellar biosynthesis protein FlhG
MKNLENHYELLKVSTDATIAEIVNAYHAAKNAFSRDSVASYSLFSNEESVRFLKELETAYLTLSNVDRKREYDRTLSLSSSAQAAETRPFVSEPAPPPTAGALESGPLATPPTNTINGAWLSQMRELRGMSLEDVARVTKIPRRLIEAIEKEDAKNLPARVYLQGFIQNLAKIYRIESSLVKTLVVHFEQFLKP